jgi:hypothetical protein
MKNLVCENTEIDTWMEILEEETTSARYRVLFRDKRSTKEAWWHRFRHALLKSQLNSWQVKRDKLFKKLLAKLEELKQTENENVIRMGRSQRRSIPSQQSKSKSKSTTRNQMNNRINISNRLKLKIMSMIYCRLSSSRSRSMTVEDSPIKTKDKYVVDENTKQYVIIEVEGPMIKPDADIKYHMITLDQEQTYIDSVMKVDTFRGGTEINLFNLSTIEVQMSDNKTMKTIMFGAQTAKQYQSNGQKYQDDMKDNPKSDHPETYRRRLLA